MKIILVHDWKIFMKIVCKSVDFISKTFINKMKVRYPVTDNFKVGYAWAYLLLKFYGVHSQDTCILHVKHSKNVHPVYKS